MCATHHLIAALSIVYKAVGWHTMVFCNNQGAVNISAQKLRRIRPCSSCADILRNIRSVRNKSNVIITYQHVKGHMDNYLEADRTTAM